MIQFTEEEAAIYQKKRKASTISIAFKAIGKVIENNNISLTRILDLGCGLEKNRYRSDDPNDEIIGLDRLPLPGVEVVWDCEKLPLPFPDETS